MKKLRISVVVSSYNGSPYIIDQLESLKDQSRQPDEVIIADDCSSDDTVNIVSKFIQSNNLKSWKLKINRTNKGWRRNFMETMWEASGDLVFPCDQDDIWNKNKISKMSEIMENHSNISILTSNYCEFWKNGKTKVGLWKNTKRLEQVTLKNNYLLVRSPGCTYCVRRSLLELSKKYWKPSYPHDALLWRLGLFSGGLYTWTEALINWRNHSNSAFAKESKTLKNVHAKLWWIKTARDFNQTLRKYTLQQMSENCNQQIKILDNTDRWLNKREKFYLTKNPLIGISLIEYWSVYPRKRQYLGDWYLIYFVG